jgi:DNA primase
MKRLTKNVIVWLDGDPGGVGATIRHLDPLRAEGFSIKVVNTPGQDPDDVIMEYKDEIHQYVIDHARMAGDFELSLRMNVYKSDLTELRMRTIRDVTSILKRIGNPVEYALYLTEVANDLGIPRTVLEEEVQRE